MGARSLTDFCMNVCLGFYAIEILLARGERERLP